MSGPWGLIASYFNALGSNISESEKARKTGEQQQYKPEGYQYGSAPELDRSNFEAGSPATAGANIIGDWNKTLGKSILGKAVEGEADLYAPRLRAEGATQIPQQSYQGQYLGWRYR